MEPQKIIHIIICLTVFVLALSIWCIGIFVWLGRYIAKLKGIQNRLGIQSAKDEASEVLRLWRDIQIQRESEQFEQHEHGKPAYSDRFDQWMQQLGWSYTFRSFILMICGAACIIFLLTYSISQNAWIGIGGVVASLYVFMQYIQNRILKRMNMFERQLVDALGVAARALRAGHPLVGAFQLISEEIGDPLGSIFGRIYQQQAFGSDLKQSISDAARDNQNTEFKLFSTAISVQMQSGGNLADLMDTLSSVIRARMRLNKRVRVLTAQTQISKGVLIGLPFLMFVLLNALNPEYMSPLYTTTEGNWMMGIMFINILLGSWMMNKMVRFNY